MCSKEKVIKKLVLFPCAFDILTSLSLPITFKAVSDYHVSLVIFEVTMEDNLMLTGLVNGKAQFKNNLPFITK